MGDGISIGGATGGGTISTVNAEGTDWKSVVASGGARNFRNPLMHSPAQQSAMFLNWLTAGGPPKPIDPSLVIADAYANAPGKRKGAQGMGFSGLFGGSSPVAPLQPGVPYSALPVPKVGGK